MMYRWLTMIVLATVAVLATGCSKPETPQQVATEFWQAVAEGKQSGIQEFSTLADASTKEVLGGDWLNTLPDFGRVVIEADRATIETILAADSSAGDAAADARREIKTYLIKVNDEWLVDYQRTQEAVTSRSPLEGLKEDINRLREQFDDAVGQSSDRISERVEQLTREFEAYSEETGKKAGEALEGFRESLETFRKQLKESLDDAQEKLEKPEEAPESKSLEQAAV